MFVWNRNFVQVKGKGDKNMNETIVKELDKILPVVVRVHGEHHPELHQVAKLYADLKETKSREILEKLRQVTDHYTAPENACPTYQKTYQDLSLLDQEME